MKSAKINRRAQITPTGEPADVVSLLETIRQKGLAPVIIIANSSIIGNNSTIIRDSTGTFIGSHQTTAGSFLTEAARKITQSQALTAAEKIKFLKVLYN